MAANFQLYIIITLLSVCSVQCGATHSGAPAEQMAPQQVMRSRSRPREDGVLPSRCSSTVVVPAWIGSGRVLSSLQMNFEMICHEVASKVDNFFQNIWGSHAFTRTWPRVMRSMWLVAVLAVSSCTGSTRSSELNEPSKHSTSPRPHDLWFDWFSGHGSVTVEVAART